MSFWRGLVRLALLTIVFLSSSFRVTADDASHSYQTGELVTVWAGAVGPEGNPEETHSVEILPLCDVKRLVRTTPSAASNVTHQNVLVQMPDIKIVFGVDSSLTEVCNMELTPAEVYSLKEMVNKSYRMKYVIGGIPIHARLGTADRAPNGEPEELAGTLFTRRDFKFLGKAGKITRADVELSDPVPITVGGSLRFTYTSEWADTDEAFEARSMDSSTDDGALFESIRWFSLFSSTAACLLLCGIGLAILARTLKNDLAKLNAATDLEIFDRIDDCGWKKLHGDVFRRPSRLPLLTILYASGVQVGTLLLSLGAAVACKRFAAGPSLLTSALAYLTSCAVSGYKQAYLFRLYCGRGWKQTAMLQALLLPSVWLACHLPVRVAASNTGVPLKLPTAKLLQGIGLFLIVCCPIHFVAGVFGRKRAEKVTFPCHPNSLHRQIPKKPKWFYLNYFGWSAAVPFGCVFMEMYSIYTSFWGNKIHYAYGFLFSSAVLFCIVVAWTSVTATYILLNADDYRWLWMSFGSGASSSLCLLGFSVWYAFRLSELTALQITIYASSCIIYTFCLALVGGALGCAASSYFVFLIYRSIKSD